jgi:hypothetical protein
MPRLFWLEIFGIAFGLGVVPGGEERDVARRQIPILAIGVPAFPVLVFIDALAIRFSMRA